MKTGLAAIIIILVIGLVLSISIFPAETVYGYKCPAALCDPFAAWYPVYYLPVIYN